MKKTLFIALMLLMINSLASFAGNAEKFTYDQSKIENQMSQLNDLEAYVKNNPGITITEMMANGNTLANVVDVSIPVLSWFDDGKPRGGGGGFILGCCVGAGSTALAAAGVVYWLYYVYLQSVLI